MLNSKRIVVLVALVLLVGVLAGCGNDGKEYVGKWVYPMESGKEGELVIPRGVVIVTITKDGEIFKVDSSKAYFAFNKNMDGVSWINGEKSSLEPLSHAGIDISTGEYKLEDNKLLHVMDGNVKNPGNGNYFIAYDKDKNEIIIHRNDYDVVFKADNDGKIIETYKNERLKEAEAYCKFIKKQRADIFKSPWEKYGSANKGWN